MLVSVCCRGLNLPVDLVQHVPAFTIPMSKTLFEIMLLALVGEWAVQRGLRLSGRLLKPWADAGNLVSASESDWAEIVWHRRCMLAWALTVATYCT